MKLKSSLLICFFSFLSILSLQAQSYNTALGVRLDTDWGVSLQQRIGNKTTIEGLLQNSFKNDRFLATVLLEQHYPILIKRLNVYAGGGVHKLWETNNDTTFDSPIGLTAIVGAEFTIARVNFSWDFKPMLNIGDNVSQRLDATTALTVRYVISKRDLIKSKEQRQKDKAKKKKKKAKQRKKDGKDEPFWKDIFN